MTRCLFPYPHPVLSVPMEEAWLEHGILHARIRQERRGAARPSGFDLATRIAGIALATRLRRAGVLGDAVRIVPGEFLSPLHCRDGSTIVVTGSTADERYNLGSRAALTVFEPRRVRASHFVLAIFDPPFVDFLGWASDREVDAAPRTGNKRVIPVKELRPMASFQSPWI